MENGRLERKDTYTRQEVYDMLVQMQREVATTQGFFAGHVTQLWVIKEMIEPRIRDLGGEGITVITR